MAHLELKKHPFVRSKAFIENLAFKNLRDILTSHLERCFDFNTYTVKTQLSVQKPKQFVKKSISKYTLLLMNLLILWAKQFISGLGKSQTSFSYFFCMATLIKGDVRDRGAYM